MTANREESLPDSLVNGCCRAERWFDIGEEIDGRKNAKIFE